MNEVWSSLKNALKGLIYCFLTQRNMLIHGTIGILVLITGFLLKVEMTEMLFLLTAVLIVLVAEVFNTAIEKTIDLYTVEKNDLARTAKDAAAGAVLLTSLYAVMVGLIILGPPLWRIIIR